MNGTRAALRLGGLGVGLAAAIAAGIWIGAVGLDLPAIVAAFVGRADEVTASIVLGLRLPRVVEAALCGAALALSGATYQALLRNPLAEPYVLGVSGGAAAGAVAALVLGLAGLGPWVVPCAAFLGGVIALGLVLRVAYVAGDSLDRRVVLLAGVVVGAFCNAAVLLLLTFADPESFRSAVFWLMGSFAGASWDRIATLLVVVLPVGVALFGLARRFDLLAVGDQTAAALGVRVERTKLLCLALAALLAAVAVSVSGVVGFVGLVVPQAVRLRWGSGHRFLLPAAALLGASFLVLADAGARVLAAPSELPIGVVTALIGVPCFVVLLRRRRV